MLDRKQCRRAGHPTIHKFLSDSATYTDQNPSGQLRFRLEHFRRTCQGTMSGHNSAYDMNDNGSAKDPVAFRAALRQDTQRMAALQAEPEIAAMVAGDDIAAFQAILRDAFQVRGCTFSNIQQDMVPYIALRCTNRPCRQAQLRIPPCEHGEAHSRGINHAYIKLYEGIQLYLDVVLHQHQIWVEAQIPAMQCGLFLDSHAVSHWHWSTLSDNHYFRRLRRR